MSDAPDTVTLHATCVALEGRALLIRGASGSGKSALALQMIALGAGLIADDRTCLRRVGDKVIASAPDAIRGQIEARGIGILSAPAAAPAPLVAVVAMDRRATRRLPKEQRADILGVSLPDIGMIDAPHFPAALCLYLRSGRIA
ncbi:serine kinase [Roseovarius spongiae]|uniref:Serine kinase n=1 Tax=Roseovarius spongiae TaxID=2320272 RepID=A0A3A8AUD0_9RHOB|nr:HPr kinase/phosphatase C-terminal domain-containing protein [Roseovarius spongiae]RKF14638.1 serine kinase [Roseovarius spongiae]